MEVKFIIFGYFFALLHLPNQLNRIFELKNLNEDVILLMVFHHVYLVSYIMVLHLQVLDLI